MPLVKAFTYSERDDDVNIPFLPKLHSLDLDLASIHCGVEVSSEVSDMIESRCWLTTQGLTEGSKRSGRRDGVTLLKKVCIVFDGFSPDQVDQDRLQSCRTEQDGSQVEVLLDDNEVNES